jgi:hypothetical protein
VATLGGMKAPAHLALSLAVAPLGAACGSDPALLDAPIDVVVARCNPDAPFGAPQPVAGLNTELGDTSARFTPDELTVVFSRRASNNTFNLFTASRASIDAAFDTPTLLTTVNSVASDVWPTLSPDGRLLLFDSDRVSPNVFHMFVARRSTPTTPFDPPAATPVLEDREVHPMLASEAALYFASAQRGGFGASEIWRAEIDAAGAISTPVAVVGGVNTADHEDAPAVTADERQIFFRRISGGEEDIYTARRSTAADGFGTSSAVAGLAEPDVREVPSWISPDGCHLYFHSDAPGGMGDEDIYLARRGI